MNNATEIYIFENSYHLTNYYTKLWSRIAVDAICNRGRFIAALSGDRTLIEFFSKLAGVENFDLWRNTYLFQVDEYFVETDMHDGNMKMIRDNLLDYVNIPTKNVFPIYTDLENAKIAADKYQRVLGDFFGDASVPVFDILNLGLDAAGQASALFSGDPMMNDNDVSCWVMPVTQSSIPHDRITLTRPVMNGARYIIFHVQGKAKARIVKQVLSGDEQFSATHLTSASGRIIFLLDKDAASALSYGDNYTNVDEGIMVKI